MDNHTCVFQLRTQRLRALRLLPDRGYADVSTGQEIQHASSISPARGDAEQIGALVYVDSSQHGARSSSVNDAISNFIG